MQAYRYNTGMPTKPLSTQRKRQYESPFVSFVSLWENPSQQTFVPLPSFVGTSVGNNKLHRNNTMKRTPTKPLSTQRKRQYESPFVSFVPLWETKQNLFVPFVPLWENPLCPSWLCGNQKQNPFVGKKYNIMKITERAAAQLKNILEKHDSPEAGIKIYATQGCCGPSPAMDVAENPGSNDTQIEIDGINFFVANELLDKIENSLIELSPGGFRIHGFPKKNSCCD